VYVLQHTRGFDTAVEFAEWRILARFVALPSPLASFLFGMIAKPETSDDNESAATDLMKKKHGAP
jgi:hypothetical protein